MCRISFTLVAVFLQYAIFCNGQNADINILKTINESESSFKTGYCKFASASVTYVNIAAPVTLFTVALMNKDKKMLKDAAYMSGGYILSSIITHGTKRLVQRTRPYNEYAFIVKRDEGGGYSFPSGHTSSAFYSATSISLLYPKWYVIAPSYLWACSVGYARMYQGVHYPSDVLAGAIIGAGSAWITYKVQRWVDKKRAAKKISQPKAL